MLKRHFLVCILTISFVATTTAQDFSALWQDYFSFFDIVDITRSDFKIYAASENVIFSYDINSNEVEKIQEFNNHLYLFDSKETTSPVSDMFSGLSQNAAPVEEKTEEKAPGLIFLD